MHDRDELKKLQSLPLELKVELTKQRIKEWVEYFGEDGVYVSFSGGKDSTVLLDIARKMYPEIKAMFVDTGLEYPEIREFVSNFDNVDWMRPDINFREVINTYGYPFVSKEAAEVVMRSRRYIEHVSSLDKNNMINDYGVYNVTNTQIENARKQSLIDMTPGAWDSKFRKIMGIAEFSVDPEERSLYSEKRDRSMYAQTKWQFP